MTREMLRALAEMNQEIFSSGDYHDFLSLCNNGVMLNLPKTTVVSAVSRLVKRGYIKREQNAQDGREQLLRLTEIFLFWRSLQDLEWGGLSGIYLCP